MIKHLFICSTPSHLINTINLTLTYFTEDELTLCILDHSDQHEDMYKKAIEIGCFKQVFLLKTKAFNHHWTQKFKVTRYLVKGLEYINHKKLTLKFIEDQTAYDKFWVSFMDRSSWLMFLTYKNVNPNIELFFLGDGIGGYRLLTVKQNRLDEMLLNVLGFKSIFEEMKELYVYEPGLAKNTLYPKIEIKPLPKIRDKNIKKILNDILSFKHKDLELLQHKYIFLEAPYSQGNVYKQQMNVMKILCDKPGNTFCIKLHPRTLMKDEDNLKCISDIHTAIEALCFNSDVSDNVFISGLSAASVMPKLMFDQEPVVIFLYKVFGLEKLTYSGDDYIEFIKEFSKTYNKKSSVYFPETTQELLLILEDLDNQDKIMRVGNKKDNG